MARQIWEIDESRVIQPEDIKFKEVEEVKRTAIINRKTELKIRALLAMHADPDFEWMGILVGKKIKQENTIIYNIEDLEIIDQQAESTTVKTTAEGAKEIQEIKNKIGWIHSHNTMGVFFSGTDEETAEAHDLSIVVNDSLEFYCASAVQIKSEETNADGKIMFVDVDVALESMVDINEMMAELADEVKEKVHRVTTQVFVNRKYNGYRSADEFDELDEVEKQYLKNQGSKSQQEKDLDLLL